MFSSRELIKFCIRSPVGSVKFQRINESLAGQSATVYRTWRKPLLSEFLREYLSSIK